MTLNQIAQLGNRFPPHTRVRKMFGGSRAELDRQRAHHLDVDPQLSLGDVGFRCAFAGESASDVSKKRQTLMDVRDAIKTKYTTHSLDFWTPFANTDGSIKTEDDRTDQAKPDGIHMNDAAHGIMAMIVIAARIPEAAIANKK